MKKHVTLYWVRIVVFEYQVNDLTYVGKESPAVFLNLLIEMKECLDFTIACAHNFHRSLVVYLIYDFIFLSIKRNGHV